ncbi:RNA polymerase sigma factor [Cryomorpha ignava]|uniref:RNA polymerase sigma factor n=1 Tax=Cryomorpha ignava TaxID=101383 RepID=UPI001EF9312D|nr:RNA polymerase sigma-70 factor [Cryomorpha ignava]
MENTEGTNRNREKLTAQEFERAFDLYYKNVRNFLYYKTSQSELAEDVAQDAFVKLWETRDKIDKSSIKAYVFTIANNLAINQLKRDQLKFKFLKLQGDKMDIKSPEYLLEMQEFDQKLQDTLAKVPDGAREVFLMNRIDGLKYREIAEMLGLSMKAVEKRMSRALAILREEIKGKF